MVSVALLPSLLGIAWMFVKQTQFVARQGQPIGGVAMELRSHYTPASGYTPLVSPQTHSLRFLTFGMLTLAPHQRYDLESGEDEVGLIVVTGDADVRIGEEGVDGLGGRASVFDGRGAGVYAPPQSKVAVRAGAAGLEMAVCRCPARVCYPVQVVQQDGVVAREVSGRGFTRYVHDILGPQIQANMLWIGETFTVEGNWSSYPPHKHDVEAPPEEVRQEELYLYKIRPTEGFGLQYLYTQPESPHGALDQAVAVRQNDLTIMPYGYHPVAAPPGYDVYYLWFLAGPTRLLHPHDDPMHAWVKSATGAARSYPQ
jgi:5-deoxy-glucuronate isomerase